MHCQLHRQKLLHLPGCGQHFRQEHLLLAGQPDGQHFAFKSMGSTSSTPQAGIPASPDGAESTSPTSTSTDVDFQSARSCALASRKLDVGQAGRGGLQPATQPGCRRRLSPPRWRPGRCATPGPFPPVPCAGRPTFYLSSVKRLPVKGARTPRVRPVPRSSRRLPSSPRAPPGKWAGRWEGGGVQTSGRYNLIIL